MNKKQFWAAIDKARKTGGGWHGMYEPLQAELSKLDVADIITWYLIFEKYRGISNKQKLWAAAATMMNGCSDDSFDYFRGWLIAQGKDVYLAALRDPDSLADVEAVKQDRTARFANIPDSQLQVQTAGTFEDTQQAQRWLDLVQAEFPAMSVSYAHLPCSIACHVGINAAGIAIIKKEVL